MATSRTNYPFIYDLMEKNVTVPLEVKIVL